MDHGLLVISAPQFVSCDLLISQFNLRFIRDLEVIGHAVSTRQGQILFAIDSRYDNHVPVVCRRR